MTSDEAKGMTNEEAKEIIFKERDSLKTNPMVKVKDCLYEAFDLAIKALDQQPCEDVGELSDGYHTFNQLYHQRAVLFACIVKQNKNKAWKSLKHSDGKYCFDRNGEWFIVGVDTPQGSYTYHYAKEYWDMFDCQELERGKEWDGHTEEDVTRLLSLEQQPCKDAISRQAAINAITKIHPVDTEYDCTLYDKVDVMYVLKDLPPVTPQPKTGRWIKKGDYAECSNCGANSGVQYDGVETIPFTTRYCHNCGARMVESEE